MITAPALLLAVTRSTYGLWGVDKPEQKRQQGSGGIGWMHSPAGYGWMPRSLSSVLISGDRSS